MAFGRFFGVHRTLVLSRLTALQPLPAFTATRSSTVTVRSVDVTMTLFTAPAAAVNTTVVPETLTTPVVAALADSANTLVEAMAVEPATMTTAIRRSHFWCISVLLELRARDADATALSESRP